MLKMKKMQSLKIRTVLLQVIRSIRQTNTRLPKIVMINSYSITLKLDAISV